MFNVPCACRRTASSSGSAWAGCARISRYSATTFTPDLRRPLQLDEAAADCFRGDCERDRARKGDRLDFGGSDPTKINGLPVENQPFPFFTGLESAMRRRRLAASKSPISGQRQDAEGRERTHDEQQTHRRDRPHRRSGGADVVLTDQGRRALRRVRAATAHRYGRSGRRTGRGYGRRLCRTNRLAVTVTTRNGSRATRGTFEIASPFSTSCVAIRR